RGALTGAADCADAGTAPRGAEDCQDAERTRSPQTLRPPRYRTCAGSPPAYVPTGWTGFQTASVSHIITKEACLCPTTSPLYLSPCGVFTILARRTGYVRTW